MIKAPGSGAKVKEFIQAFTLFYTHQKLILCRVWRFGSYVFAPLLHFCEHLWGETFLEFSEYSMSSSKSFNPCSATIFRPLATVIGHKSSCKTWSFTVRQDSAKSIQKIITVGIIAKNLSSMNPSHNDMLQRSWAVYAGFSKQVDQVSKKSDFADHKSEQRPL
jgi:hypothetical protein